MKSVPRFAGIALVLLGCDSGATNPPPQPGPDIEGRLVPAVATVRVGESVELALELTGSSAALGVDWSCETGAANLASAETTERGCLVTGKDAGVVPITIRLRSATRTGRATAEVTVVR